jgi:hypothetical protein
MAGRMRPGNCPCAAATQSAWAGSMMLTTAAAIPAASRRESNSSGVSMTSRPSIPLKR